MNVPIRPKDTALFLDGAHAIQWNENSALLWHLKDNPTAEEVAEGNVWCVGSFFIGQNGWTIESKDPLTLSPSFLCHCGHHGFVRDGQWVKA